MYLQSIIKLIVKRKPQLFSFQGSLPNLPVPELEKTMERVSRFFKYNFKDIYVMNNLLQGIYYEEINRLFCAFIIVILSAFLSLLVTNFIAGLNSKSIKGGSLALS